MAATPKFGTMTFLGVRSGRIYNIDVYHSDVNDALLTFDAGAGASSTSPTSWRSSEPVLLIDYAIVTGTADTFKLQVLRNNAPVGDFLRYDQHLTTSATRSPVRVGFAPGTDIRAIQKT